MVTIILFDASSGVEEAKGLVEDAPEAGVVAAVGEDSGSGLETLGGKVFKINLLNDLGTGRCDGPVGTAVVVADAKVAARDHVVVEVG